MRVEPAEKGLYYAANNYAIGSAQISAIRNNPDDAASYPAIGPIEINLADYDCIIIGAPLWWSNMAAPLQTFLFRHGKDMAGKKIGLIVSSASSGISGVESDARRLIPDGEFLSPSLWISSSQTSNASSMLRTWLKEIAYESLVAGMENINQEENKKYTVYGLNGTKLLTDSESNSGLSDGFYILSGKKTLLRK